MCDIICDLISNTVTETAIPGKINVYD